MTQLSSNPIFGQLISSGISFTVFQDRSNLRTVYRIEGFYKSGFCDLQEIDGKLFAYTRYDQSDVIESMEDLIRLNYDWWQNSKWKGWTEPEAGWGEMFVAQGLAKKTEKVVTEWSTQ